MSQILVEYHERIFFCRKIWSPNPPLLSKKIKKEGGASEQPVYLNVESIEAAVTLAPLPASHVQC